jgi:hypothetical protein
MNAFHALAENETRFEPIDLASREIEVSFNAAGYLKNKE